MNRKSFVLMSFLLATVLGSFAQGGMPRRTVEERVKAAMEKMAPLQLTAEQTTKADSIFNQFYTDQQKAMQEMRSGGNMDRDAMREKRKEMMEGRDAKLKQVLSESQFSKFKEEIEPAMMPQRGGNGGGRANG